jgi:hypothetical protein
LGWIMTLAGLASRVTAAQQSTQARSSRPARGNPGWRDQCQIERGPVNREVVPGDEFDVRVLAEPFGEQRQIDVDVDPRPGGHQRNPQPTFRPYLSSPLMYRSLLSRNT